MLQVLCGVKELGNEFIAEWVDPLKAGNTPPGWQNLAPDFHELLELLKRMVGPNEEQRPSAQEVVDGIRMSLGSSIPLTLLPKRWRGWWSFRNGIGSHCCPTGEGTHVENEDAHHGE